MNKEKNNRTCANLTVMDTFSACHPFLNFFYFTVVLFFTMFNQHPVFIGISYVGAFSYSFLLNGWEKTLKHSFLLTLPGLLIVALLNPMFNHYGVTMLYYVKSSGNWITLEALVYGVVLGAVMFVVIQWLYQKGAFLRVSAMALTCSPSWLPGRWKMPLRPLIPCEAEDMV